MTAPPFIQLGKVVVDVRSGFASGVRDPSGVVQLRMNNVTSNGGLDWSRVLRVPHPKNDDGRYILRSGDVLFNATNSPSLVGKSAIFQGYGEPVAFSNHFLRIRVNEKQLDAGYLARWLTREQQAGFFETRCSQWVNQASFRREDLLKLCLPLPSLTEQRRIAAILDKADAVRRQRACMTRLAADLLPAIFQEMFGDPVMNSRGWPTESLGDLCTFVSGATPPTGNPDFWSGDIPWVSPKDMKSSEVQDAIDHVSHAALRASRLRLLPANTVLIVIRGMILAHTFPVAIARVPVTINQDMKGVIPSKTALPDYIHWLLKAFSMKCLSLVSTASHGTKRIEMGTLLKLRFPVPPLGKQIAFAACVAKVQSVETCLGEQRAQDEELFSSLAQRAFQGGL